MTDKLKIIVILITAYIISLCFAKKILEIQNMGFSRLECQLKQKKN